MAGLRRGEDRDGPARNSPLVPSSSSGCHQTVTNTPQPGACARQRKPLKGLAKSKIGSAISSFLRGNRSARVIPIAPRGPLGLG